MPTATMLEIGDQVVSVIDRNAEDVLPAGMPLVGDAELSNAREDPFATHGRGVLGADLDPNHPTRGGGLPALRDRRHPPLGSAADVPLLRDLWARRSIVSGEELERLGGG